MNNPQPPAEFANMSQNPATNRRTTPTGVFARITIV
jgi:hypothetical protein